jgi:hypothetical protein
MSEKIVMAARAEDAEDWRSLGFPTELPATLQLWHDRKRWNWPLSGQQAERRALLDQRQRSMQNEQ